MISQARFGPAACNTYIKKCTCSSRPKPLRVAGRHIAHFLRGLAAHLRARLGARRLQRRRLGPRLAQRLHMAAHHQPSPEVHCKRRRRKARCLLVHLRQPPQRGVSGRLAVASLATIASVASARQQICFLFGRWERRARHEQCERHWRCELYTSARITPRASPSSSTR